jgi:multiple sugar transport system permease protein
MSPAGRVRTLRALTGILLVIAAVAAVWAARGQVREGETTLVVAEAGVAARVFEATRDTTSLSALLGGRWQVAPTEDDVPEAPAAYRAGGALAARAPVLDADGWTAIATLDVVAREPRSAGAPFLIALLTALLALVAVAERWTRPDGRAAWGFAAALVLALPVAVGALASSADLRALSDARLTLAADALRLTPDSAPIRREVGGLHRLTGVPVLARDAAQASVTGLPGAAVDILRTGEPGPGARLTADGIAYGVTDVGPVRVVLLPYEQRFRPGPAATALALIGLGLAALPAALARLAGDPRALGRTVVAWSFLAPAALHLAVFTLAPLLFATWLSLHRWSLLDVARPFVGLGNYAAVLADAAWWNAIRNTAVFTLHVPVSMALALGLALLTHRRLRGVAALRAVFFLPTITSLVAIAISWQWMFHPEFGLLNWLLSLVGIAPQPWLTSPRTALAALMLMAVWLVVGYQMVLFQAGLAAIPRDLYDAARMDGAGPWRRFVHVTLPGLRHTLFFVLVTSVIGSFQIFGAVYVMTEGGPLHATDVAVFHIYEEAWEFFRFGRAAAMSWMLFGIIFALTWLQFRVLERRTEPA